MVADLINNHAQEKTEHVEYYLVSHNESENHAEGNGNLERREVSKDRGSRAMHKMLLLLLVFTVYVPDLRNQTTGKCNWGYKVACLPVWS